MSAIGSVFISVLPARFLHAGKVAQQSVLAEADPAERELADESACSATEATAIASAPGELRSLVEGLLIECFSCHGFSLLSTLGERHPEKLEQPLALFVCTRAGANGDLHAANFIDLVVLDLGE